MANPNEIEVGDVVTIDISFEGDGYGLVGATVLHVSCNEFDVWKVRSKDGKLHYIQRYCSMMLVRKGGA